MNYKEAIEAIKSNYPPEHYTMLREALDLAMEVLREKIDEEEYDKFIDNLTSVPTHFKLKSVKIMRVLKADDKLE